MTEGHSDDCQYKQMVEELGDGIFEVDTNGKIRYCNDSFCALVNDSTEEPQELSELFDKEIVEQITGFGSQFTNEQERKRIDTTLSTSTGKELPVEIQLTAKMDDADEKSIFGSIRSVEDWHERLEELEEYKLLLDRAPVGMYITDETGNFHYWNESAFELHELDGDVNGVQWTDVVADEDIPSFVSAMERLTESTDPHTEVIKHSRVTDTGKSFPSENYLTLIPTSKGFRGVGVMLDVTERERRKQRLKVMQRLLRHNLRNEMSVILSQAEVIAQQADADSQSMANRIIETGNKLLETTERLRNLDETLEKSTEVQSTIDIVSAINEVINENYADKDVPLSVDLPEEALIAGSSHLKIAIDEIFDNAMLHGISKQDEGQIQVWIEELTAKQRDRYTIHIKDNGPGIPKQDRQVVLEEQPVSDLSHSSGLGLWIAKWIVEDCGGNLEIEIDDGSEVRLILPQA